MQLQEYTLVLTGGQNSRTCVLNRIQFVNGVGCVSLYATELDTFLRYMGRSFRAYLAGSKELEDAQAKDEKNGIQRNLQTNPARSDRAPASVQGAADSSAGQVSGEGALLRIGVDEDKTGSPGLVPGGPGHTDAGMGKRVVATEDRESDALIASIRSTVYGFAWDASECWNDAGYPSVEYVCEALKNQSITREMIDFACPGYNKNQAEDRQNL